MSRFPGGRFGPAACAAGAAVLLVAVSARYGWHRDELYFYEAGRHLGWGYVDFPPFVALVARASRVIFGDSLVGLRLWPALAVAGTVLVTAAMAREFGGDRRTQTLAAFGAALCPVFLGMGHLLSTATFDLLAWALLTWLVIRLVNGADERLWLVAGAVVGVGFLNKHSMLFVAVALLAALAVSPRRGLLARPWPWMGAAVAMVIAAPNVAWHATHDWPVVDMMRSLSDESEPLDSVVFGPAQFAVTGLTAFLWFPGLRWLLGSDQGRPWRPIAVAWVLLAGFFVLTGGKPYYLAGMYPALLAAGAVSWSEAGRIRRPAGAVAVGVLALPLALPVLPVAHADAIPVEDLEVEFGAQLGWPRLVGEVADAVRSLDADPSNVVIVTSNYGEAGAIDRFGPSLGLPRAFSRHNHYWLWGPPPDGAGTAVVVGFSREEVTAWFRSCDLKWRFVTPHGVASEEEGAPVWACRGQRVSWARLWPTLRSYSA